MDFTKSEIFNKEITHYIQIYLIFMYHSILFIGQNDMGPVNEIEIAGAVLILMGNFFINLILFGNLMGIVDTFI